MTSRPTSVSRFSSSGGGLVSVLIFCALALAGRGDGAFGRDDTQQRVSLADGVTASLNAAADMTITTASGRTLLKVQSPRLESRRHRGDSAPRTFFFETTEGADGGHRGFSRRADDDGDGAIDEDRIDGRDNDGDGAVDEDFAAIGDRMNVVHRLQGGRDLHLETYHWNYEHLRRILVLSWDAHGLENDDVLMSLDGAAWTATGVGWASPRRPAHGLMNRTMAVTRLSDLDGEYWLGLSVLSTGPSDPVLRIESSDLRLRIGGGCDVAICIAPTLSQLRCHMATAQRLAVGTVAASGTIVPWIVPPPRKEDPEAQFTARRIIDADGTVLLEFTTPEHWSRLPDPATIRLDERLLLAPSLVSWRPADEDSESQVWTERWPDSASWQTAALAPHPFLAHRDLLESGEASVWTFSYPGGVPDFDATRLELQTMCGHDVAADLESIELAVNVPEEQEARTGDQEIPSFSPNLIEGFPNPFVDFLQMRFTVPETIGEGFDPDPEDPLYLKSSDLIPYSSPMPRVTVTIYTVSGRAVMTVFDEICGFGEYRASWNCLDDQGRPMATGTYFCRLQIENWSVTQRVALLR